MSEMTVMITKKTFLDVCMGIEGLCADLYHHYSKIFEDIPEASRLWKKTALEEEHHLKQFELVLRLMNDTEFEVPKDNLKRVYSIQYKLQKHLEHIKTNRPELMTAVSKSVEMEEILADLHVHTSLNFRDDSMQDLFKALSEADNEHVADMQRYRKTLNPSLCKMQD